MLPYTQKREGGTWRYRRTVHPDLQPIIKKKNFTVTLGNNEREALAAYAKVHAQIERVIREAEKVLAERQPVDTSAMTKLEFHLKGVSRVRRMGFDPHQTAVDLEDPESVASDHAKTMTADMILEDYPVDPHTGDPVGVSKMDEFVVQALYNGAPDIPEPTLEDAKKLYVAERISGSELEVKKKTQRVERIIGNMEEALGRPPTIPRFTRADAKLVRDHMLSGTLKPSSVKRDLNVAKAMFNHIITEMQLAGVMNPFAKLPIAGLNEEPEDSLREPLPDDVLASVRSIVLNKANVELQNIWRLLEGTGCRLAEVSGLRREDVRIDEEYPHIIVTWHEGRRIKTNASKREVPLVGDALEAAIEALAESGDDPEMLFPRYKGEDGPGKVSAALMKHVRTVTVEEGHAVHSLRHNMKDRLILAEVSEYEQNLILGHAVGGVGNKSYGSRSAKLKAIHRAMTRAFASPTGATGREA